MTPRTLLLAALLSVWFWPTPEATPPATIPSMDVDSARAELRLGRFWHASRILRQMATDSRGLSSEITLLLAEADAGWRYWDGVIQGLEGFEGVDVEAGSAALVLLARAYEGEGDWEEAAQSYARLRALANAEVVGPTGARYARVLAMTDGWDRIGAQLALLGADDPRAAEWSRLEAAEIASAAGNAPVVRDLVRGFSDTEVASRAWELEARAYLVDADSAMALVEYEVVLPTVTTDAQRSRTWAQIGALRASMDDRAGALRAYRASLAASSRGPAAARAALGVLRLATPAAEEMLTVARTLDRAGDGRSALVAYDRYLGLSPDGGSPDVMLAHARLLASDGRPEEAVRAFRRLQNVGDSAFQLRLLDRWRSVRRSQGRRDAARTIDEWILERHPHSGQAVEILFFRGDALQDGRRMAEAIGMFERAADALPSHATAGQARMRAGQVHLELGEVAAAGAVFNDYLEVFPTGRRWAEAAYWLGYTHMVAGERERALPLFARIRKDDPLGYYAVLAAEALGEVFTAPLDEPDPTAQPQWLAASLDTLDVLLDAGLSLGTNDFVTHIAERAASSPEDQLTLGEALLDRGLSVEGINMGWAAQEAGYGWDRRLARVVFPFPYREIIRREAAERGLDPILLAALIRQESAFTAQIHSRAGAIGLMQVMPETGRQIARAERVLGYSPESLETAEINLHLGTTFLSDMNQRFGGRHLALLLSAYNAGPTRANRWRRFPEVDDELRFIERIPFTETRGYVKNIRRNLALYRFLYGD